MVQQMNLGELTLNAEKIFRGTVVRVESGTIEAGGGVLPTVTYVIHVTESLKGHTSSVNGKIARTSVSAKTGATFTR